MRGVQRRMDSFGIFQSLLRGLRFMRLTEQRLLLFFENAIVDLLFLKIFFQFNLNQSNPKKSLMCYIYIKKPSRC